MAAKARKLARKEGITFAVAFSRIARPSGSYGDG